MDMNEINELIAVQKAYKKVHDENITFMCGIDEKRVHITENVFLEIFDEYEVHEFSLSEYEDKLVAYKDDVQFICLSDRRKRNEKEL